MAQELNPNQVEELVKKSKLGETTAFDRLVDHYKDRIYNYVARMVHDPVEAEDIAQEAFVKAYRNLPSFRGASTFQTWLYRIAANLTIDTVRRRRRRENTYSLDAPWLVEGDEQDRPIAREQEDDSWAGRPDEEAEKAELQRAVHRAIQKLSPKLRTVIVQYELQGLSYEEMADILGCPEGTVKSRLFNAREELKRMLVDILPAGERTIGRPSHSHVSFILPGRPPNGANWETLAEQAVCDRNELTQPLPDETCEAYLVRLYVMGLAPKVITYLLGIECKEYLSSLRKEGKLTYRRAAVCENYNYISSILEKIRTGKQIKATKGPNLGIRVEDRVPVGLKSA